MNWFKKKDKFFAHLRNLNNSNRNSHLKIPILINTINVTQASTQTLEKNFNNNADRHKHRRRKYQHRFNKCLTELIEKYPPIPAHDDLKENDEMNSCVWSKLLESREDLLKLNEILEDLDKRLEYLSLKE